MNEAPRVEPPVRAHERRRSPRRPRRAASGGRSARLLAGVAATLLVLSGCGAAPERGSGTSTASTAARIGHVWETAPATAGEVPARSAGTPGSAPAPSVPGAGGASVRGGDPGGGPPPETTFQIEGQVSDHEQRVLKAVALCVRAAAERGEPSGAPLDVALTVDAEGRVVDTALAAGYASSAAACVERDLASLTFTARPGGGVRFVRYPIASVSLEDAD